MYFNEKLGRYVERGKEDEAAAAANIAPPPIMAAWSQPAAAMSPSTQPGFSEDKFAVAGAGGTSAAELPLMAASSLPLPATGPPMPSGAPRVAAPASASALGKSRCAMIITFLSAVHVVLCWHVFLSLPVCFAFHFA
jgi:hypothetical protein